MGRGCRILRKKKGKVSGRRVHRKGVYLVKGMERERTKKRMKGKRA